MLSSVGIGAARVDTLLARDQYRPGETIDARVQLIAGQVDQRIDGIHFSVHSRLAPKQHAKIAHCTLAEGLTLKANTVMELPVKLALPQFAPISSGPIESWLHTGLEIPKALDPTDIDPIAILPTSSQQAVLDALAGLGLEQTGVEIEPLPSQSRLGLPFLQQWHYRPGEGAELAGVEQLSCAWRPLTSGLELMMDYRSPSGQHYHHALLVPEDNGTKLKPKLRNLLTSHNLTI
ncbi:sporulation protein [Ferrimonas balearica]|uniref:sporulation protein n=1 Tax=Ferrimonas balearica TaxID=44012 RepID=UPI001C99BAE5|nr:sporulation protein [Ferrimonas balearica]MBY5992636.1 sporulation protein [Ferrimonas balearica]